MANFTYEEQEQDWQEWIQSNPDDILLVAILEPAQVIGYALTRVEQDIYPGYAAEIVAIHVTQRRQKQGVGGALVKQTAAVLQERGCPSVMLWTLEANLAREWYENLGGKILGERSSQSEDRDIVEIAYGWDTLGPLLPGSTGKHIRSDITGG